MISVAVLGSLELRRDGDVVPVRPGKTTEILIRLALEAGTSVRTERLIEDLWVDEAPATARNTLQTKVSRLRRALGDPKLVTGASGGYTLHVDPGAVDALEVARLARHASALRAGDPAAALEAVTAALQLFRGEPLVDAGEGSWLVPHRVRLEELRLGLLEDRFGALLDLGEAGTLVPDLEALVAEHPLREGLWGLLMVALYRDGRQADALAAYTRARTHLGEELGLDPGPALQAIEGQVLAQDPALARPATAAPVGLGGNLPGLTTSLIGREEDLVRTTTLVERHRLVTLVGPAGVGKTRLGIEVARAGEVGATWFVRLDSATDRASLAQAVGEALDLPRSDERSVVDHLRGARALVVLDSCEHVADQVAAVVTRILDSAPMVRVLCTSQVPIGLDGEVVQPIEPLSVADSMQLFAERAIAHGRKGAVGDGIAAELEAVCRSLDGLPLAIELAAARTKTLSVAEIGRRLDDRFALLHDPNSRGSDRRRALSAAIAWSYDLLFPDDQRGLWALAAFADGASLAALEHVIGAMEVPATAALDVVTRLVDRSLVVVDTEGGDEVRYRLLDSIRAFARDRSREAGLADVARASHAEWFGAAAAGAAAELKGPGQRRHLVLARTEAAEIDAALSWSMEHRPALALRIANGFGWAWFVLGEGPQGSARVRRALAAAGDAARPEERVESLYTSAWLDCTDAFETSIADAERAISVAVELGDDALGARARTALAFTLVQQGRAADALEALHGCAALLERADRPWDAACALVVTAHCAAAAGDLDLARTASDAAERTIPALGDDWALDHLHNLLAVMAVLDGRLDEATAHLRISVEIAQRFGFRTSEAFHLADLGHLLHLAGDHEEATRVLGQAIDVGQACQDRRVVARARANLGRALLAMGDRDGARAAATAAHHWFQVAGGDGAQDAADLVAALD